ncbi:hypothetical protein AALH12_07180 [Streptococcus ferus]|uniref:hypothetical protein n=1 Tax=Streptococcus ferus TaxID=1345 RepID=UPI003519887A
MLEIIKEFISYIYEEILLNVIAFVLYIISLCLYLRNVAAFNEKYADLDNYFDVMTVEDGLAWKLFFLAILFALLAIGISFWNVKRFRYVGGYSKLALIVISVILLMTIFVIYRYIDNPILRATLVVLFCGGLVGLGISDSYR